MMVLIATGKAQLFVSIVLGVLVLVVLVLVVLIAIALYRTVRLWLSTQPPHLPNSFVALAPAAAADQDSISIEVGLDAATLGGFPRLLYSEAKTLDDINGGSSSTTCCCCSICLTDYKESDVLRLLPDCGHVFHVKCIDPWLRLRPTCPNCRNSPLPTPLAAPLAEVTPFARQPD